MKYSFSVSVLLVFTGYGSVLAQAPVVPSVPHPHSLSLNVDPAGAGGSTRSSEGTNGRATEGSKLNAGLAHQLRTTQTQTTSSKETLQITVRNFAAQPDVAQVEWYFVGAPVSPAPGAPLSEQQFVFDQGSKSVNLQGSGNETFAAESKEVTATISRKNMARMGRFGNVTAGNRGAGAQTESGSKLQGWFVRVVADGKVIAARGSKDEFEEIAKDDKKLAALKDDAAPEKHAAGGKR